MVSKDSLTFNVPRMTIRPSHRCNYFTFKFFLISKTLRWRQSPSSPSPVLIGQDGPHRIVSSTALSTEGSLSMAQMQEALEIALGQLSLALNWRQLLIGIAWRLITQACSANCDSLYRNVDILFPIFLDRDVVVDSSGEQIEAAGCIAPAVDSSIRWLRRYEVVDSEVVEESCCVCLDDFAGGADAVCLPCEHVFHHGCIGKWLRTSRYCPLCRFEMPTSLVATM